MSASQTKPRLNIEWYEVSENVFEAKVRGGYFYLRAEPVPNKNAFLYVVRGWNNAISGEVSTLEAARQEAEVRIFETLESAVQQDFPVEWRPVDGEVDSYDSFHTTVANGFLYAYLAPYGNADNPRYLIDLRGWGAAMSHSEASLEAAQQKASEELSSLLKIMLNEG